MKYLAVLAVSVYLVLPAAAFAAPDTTPPVITLFGGSVSALQGNYQEPGYSALDNVDGDITLNVFVSGLGDLPGDYTLSYNVSDAAGNPAATETRSVNIYGGGVANPCVTNGTCPCPINTDSITGDHSAWKSCAMLRYPKLSNGSTLVCRLAPVMPGQALKCAIEQAGFGEETISPEGIELIR